MRLLVLIERMRDDQFHRVSVLAHEQGIDAQALQKMLQTAHVNPGEKHATNQ